MKYYQLCFPCPSPALAYAQEKALALGHQVTLDPRQAEAVVLPVPTPPMELPGCFCPIFGGSRSDCIDLLQDPYYVASNAAITAHCAIALAAAKLPCILPQAHILILGWGRIAQSLAQLCQNLGCRVTVAARKDSQLAMANALGCEILPLAQGEDGRFSLVLNTVPAPVWKAADGQTVIDLASIQGVSGPNVIHARGLPGKMAPKSSGELIIDTVLRKLEERI